MIWQLQLKDGNYIKALNGYNVVSTQNSDDKTTTAQDGQLHQES
jgi:hypothetical protein